MGSHGSAGEADADFEARLYAEGVAFDADDAALLEAIADAGSLNAAAASLDRSYSRAHKRLSALEGAFGSLVERQRGGSGGGGSRLTPLAESLLGQFERLRAEFSGVAETETTVLDGTVLERDGELGVVETAAGELRALVPAGVDDVQVSIRADAVTLQAPDSTPLADATSARNRLVGVVSTVEMGESVATVDIDVGAETGLTCLVTRRSVDLLGLAPGVEVVASLKATTIRAIPR
ncbi:TOBE domain-containing protein [Halapricum salinum]|uniref:LysR family transcriptional regulator n=1 Tax=Halapricum salinum TaxID=1457250 RepID=A0A4D6H8F0_9EURY|nr:TOBE domain-containing protein [Halapricum salinum]QCC50040.1 LysR family transcriptional regulator [Halapricum salinum]